MLSSLVNPRLSVPLLFVLIALSWWSIYLTRPPQAKPDTAPPTEFSAGRAMQYVRQIAREPHAMGTPGHARVRAYLLNTLRSSGLQPEVQEATVTGSLTNPASLVPTGAMFGTASRLGYVYNVMARIKGRQRGKAVLLMAHYDSQPNTLGAADDGAGVAAVLETARAIWQGKPLQHDLILLFTDGEENGLFGATAFLRHPSSKDGTKVPMFLITKKNLPRNGTAPALLTAYGGYGFSETPYFAPARFLALAEQGVVCAVANIRGGGEYGEKWHHAGMKQNTQNRFDDFIAAGEYLVKEGYAAKDKLAMTGGSHGGNLVGTVMTQRPDLFKVALPAVGVMDMLRFHKFTHGWNWQSEYGRPDSLADFKLLYGYSPAHNVKAGTPYPATLVVTADHDDRVVPMHSFKFISELQAKQSGSNPVLIRIDTNSGHGSSSFLKYLDDTADMYAFMLANVGITPAFTAKYEVTADRKAKAKK